MRARSRTCRPRPRCRRRSAEASAVGIASHWARPLMRARCLAAHLTATPVCTFLPTCVPKILPLPMIRAETGEQRRAVCSGSGARNNPPSISFIFPTPTPQLLAPNIVWRAAAEGKRVLMDLYASYMLLFAVAPLLPLFSPLPQISHLPPAHWFRLDPHLSSPQPSPLSYDCECVYTVFPPWLQSGALLLV